MKLKIVILCIIVMLSGLLAENSVIDKVHYTTVSQLGLTVTNYGVLGEYYKDPDQPSCMYKQHTDNIKEQIEHMAHGGLWVGGKLNDEKRVTTAIVDGVFNYGEHGFEFTNNGDSVLERSSIPSSPLYSPDAISHQDFLTTFHDTGIVDAHNPLYIQIDQTSFAWNYSFAEAFVIFNYHITNIGDSSIQDVFVGFWADVAVGNMNYTSIYEQGGGWSWYDNLNGFDESVFDPIPGDAFQSLDRNIAYSYDTDGDNGYSRSYVGFSFLGSQTVPRAYWDTHYNQWKWNTTSDFSYPEYFKPTTDPERYDKLTTSVPKHFDDANYTSEGYPSQSASWMSLISAGPFGSRPANTDSSSWELAPGESFDVAFTVVCGEWADSSSNDNAERRTLLLNNADVAQNIFNGEDLNGNGCLDEGEDQNDNAILDHYAITPSTSIDFNKNDRLPDKFTLSQNYPNPFNPITTIPFEVRESSHVTLQIFDITGRLVTTLVDDFKEAGNWDVKWNADNYSSGIYIYRLEYGDRHISRKMLLMK
ncbi:MAG: T9SS type A sorting domain-containing protein [Candidatus Marinimicrobia bacterium]|nr:T9SS type A sorting domain-containing protein [Candidatus Neomarinimicrobiota bacterium]